MTAQQNIQVPDITRDNALLINSWQRICEGFQLDVQHTDISGVYDQLYTHYAEPERYYHNLQHLSDCLKLWQEVWPQSERPHELGLALWFHDAIYDPQRDDNEAKSAEWASAFLQQQWVSDEVVQRVHALIMTTQHHEAEGKDQQLMVDIDLATLGSEPDQFDAYQQHIRQEYAFVPEETFMIKRKEILESFIQRPRLYLTPYFFDRFEKVARTNLTRALLQLS